MVPTSNLPFFLPLNYLAHTVSKLLKLTIHKFASSHTATPKDSGIKVEP